MAEEPRDDDDVEVTIAVLDTKVTGLMDGFRALDKKVLMLIILVAGLAGEKGVQAVSNMSEALAATDDEVRLEEEFVEDASQAAEDVLIQEMLRGAGSDQ